MYPRREMLDLVLIDGKARGIITRNLLTGEIERHGAHAVVLATGGYGTIYYMSTLAVNSNASAAWKAHKKGAFFANPSFVQIHPTCVPQLNEFQSKLTLMSESLRNDGRIWVPITKDDKEQQMIYLKKREIIILSAVILLSGTWYPVMLLQGLPRNVAMLVLVLVNPDLPLILTSEMQLKNRARK